MSDHNGRRNQKLSREIERRRSEWNSERLRNRQRNYKTVLLGACGVGKTSLVFRHLEDNFNPASDSTIGAAFHTSTIDTSIGEVKLGIWDTAGQERYSSLVPMYYRDADIALVVFDLTDRSTIDKAKHWIATLDNERGRVNSDISNIDIILVGNKMDKDEHLIGILDRDAADYAKEMNIPYMKASARSGLGVCDIFARAIIDKLKTESEVGSPETDLFNNSIRLDEASAGPRGFSCLGIPKLLTLDYWRWGKTPEPIVINSATDDDNSHTDRHADRHDASEDLF